MSRARDFAKLDPASALQLQALAGSSGKFPCFTADDTFRLADIVGTVSQTSGVPTGSIIEQGSNSNGYYVRYADGTQICGKLWDTAVVTNSAAGNVFFFNGVTTFTHAALFVGYPDVADASRWTHPTNGNAATSRGWCHVATTAPNGTSLLVFGASSVAGMYPGYIAIGRWY